MYADEYAAEEHCNANVYVIFICLHKTPSFLSKKVDLNHDKLHYGAVISKLPFRLMFSEVRLLFELKSEQKQIRMSF